MIMRNKIGKNVLKKRVPIMPFRKAITLKAEDNQTAIYVEGRFTGVVDKPIRLVRKMTPEEIERELT